MADIVVKGETADVLLFENDTDGWSFKCSKGAWCEIEIPGDRFLENAVQEAIVHVDRHDGEDRANA